MLNIFFSKIFFMKNDLNDEVLNGTPKILILFYGVLTKMGFKIR